MTADIRPPILHGVRVVECADFVAGPFAGHLFAALGADVVKVEPLHGDSARRSGPFAGGAPHRERAATFLAYNSGKRSLRLNLAARAGRRLLDVLLDDADVFLTDFSPAELAHHRCEPARLQRQYPSLIVASVTPYGLSGPAADLPSTPLTRIHSAGTAHVLVRGLGADLGKPIATGGHVNEADGGMACALATIAALIARGDRDEGDGQLVEIAVQEAMSSLDRVDLSIAYNDPQLSRIGRTGAFGGRLECSDGYVIVVMPQPHQWAGMVAAMGDPAWAFDADGNLLERNADNAAALDKGFRAWCATRTREEVYRAGQAHSAPIGPVYRPSEVLASRQEEERGFFPRVPHPDAGALPIAGLPARYSDADPPPPRPAPRLGADGPPLIAPCLPAGWTTATARRAGLI